MKRIFFFVLALLMSTTVFGQTKSGFIKTSPVITMGLGFELIDSALLMSIGINGGTLTNEDQFGFRINGFEKSQYYDILDKSDPLDLSKKLLSLPIEIDTAFLIASTGIDFLFINNFFFTFTEKDMKKVANTAKKSLKSDKYKSIMLEPYWFIYIKFGYDLFHEPEIIVDMDGAGKVLSKGDTIGYNVTGAKYQSYIAYDNESSVNLIEESEYFPIDTDEIDLLVEDGLEYFFINNYVYYFTKNDREVLAEAARKVFK